MISPEAMITVPADSASTCTDWPATTETLPDALPPTRTEILPAFDKSCDILPITYTKPSAVFSTLSTTNCPPADNSETEPTTIEAVPIDSVPDALADASEALPVANAGVLSANVNSKGKINFFIMYSFQKTINLQGLLHALLLG
jgi:hypothetical protein